MHERQGAAAVAELRRDSDWEQVFTDHWNALGAESKAALVEAGGLGVPFVTLRGRYGGSALAAAGVNALLLPDL